MKPLIGIPMDLVPDIDNKLASGMPELMIALTPQATIDAVRAGGGDAVGLPLVKSLDEALELCQHIDGLVVPVGDDLAPESSGVPLGRYSGKSRLFKDESDIWYIKAMIQLHRPVFGCCRGMQLINSALGGNMHEHLPLITDGSIVHSAPASKAWSILHEVTVEPDSFLAKAVGVTRLPVNSFHHLSLKKLGDGLRCVATTDDGVVEAVENADGTIAGVQWHPECLFDRMPEQKKIFEAFVALVQKTMQQATA